jgi:hypothetical protein
VNWDCHGRDSIDTRLVVLPIACTVDEIYFKVDYLRSIITHYVLNVSVHHTFDKNVKHTAAIIAYFSEVGTH